MGYKEECKCGHDKSTHFKDLVTGQRGGCLGLNCNDCKAYREPGTPDPPPEWTYDYKADKSHIKPHADLACDCSGCLSYHRRRRF